MCMDAGFYADAISRAYYAMMHGAQAALGFHQVQVQTHRGIANQFGLHFVRAGLVERQWGISLRQRLDVRMRADYDVMAVFDEADAERACETAAAFLDRIRLLLPPELAADKPAACP